ncbi:MAG: LysM peptidoglycan-binding domain-containing M23 family metallopeptidase [Chloroflexota bacterium]|nr:LysM peptidoglycan-binding domain-containing M23 family metallopeptidase [Chloroflexota bacterium]
MDRLTRSSFLKILGSVAGLLAVAPLAAIFSREQEAIETKDPIKTTAKFSSDYFPRVAREQNYQIETDAERVTPQNTQTNSPSESISDSGINSPDEVGRYFRSLEEENRLSNTADSFERSAAILKSISYEYVIKPGDSLTAISLSEGIELDYIIWNNAEVGKPDEIFPGVKLRIPTVPGIIHAVRYGETLTEIAEQYEVSVPDIVGFAGNEITTPDRIPVGKEILIPNGRKSLNIIAYDGSLTTLDWNWPVTSRYITSLMDWRHPLGIDIGTSAWAQVYTSRAGLVTFAGGDPRYSYGYYIIIDHGFGYESLYAHIAQNSNGWAAFNVGLGERVSAGQLIAWVGMTGRTTGPHLHYEISRYGQRMNPLSVLPKS